MLLGSSFPVVIDTAQLPPGTSTVTISGTDMTDSSIVALGEVTFSIPGEVMSLWQKPMVFQRQPESDIFFFSWFPPV